MVHAAHLDLLHLLLERGLGYLPSSGSSWWPLGICVMVKRVSEMSERKVSKSKCCLPPGSSSSSPSSMGTTLQKSWLHHFSVGFQTSSSCMRWSEGARWAPLVGRVRAWLPSSSPKPHTWHPGASRRVNLPILRAWHPIPLGSSHPGAFIHPPPKLPSAGSVLHPLFPSSPPFPDSPALDWRALPPGWTCEAGRRGQPGSPPRQGGQGVGQSQGQGRSGQCSGVGSLGGSAWPPRVHICLYSTGSGLSSCCSGGTGGVWWYEAASALPARGTPGFIGPERVAGEEAGPRSTPCGRWPRLCASMPKSGHLE